MDFELELDTEMDLGMYYKINHQHIDKTTNVVSTVSEYVSYVEYIAHVNEYEKRAGTEDEKYTISDADSDAEVDAYIYVDNSSEYYPIDFDRYETESDDPMDVDEEGCAYDPMEVDEEGLIYDPMEVDEEGCAYDPMEVDEEGCAYDPMDVDEEGHGSDETDETDESDVTDETDESDETDEVEEEEEIDHMDESDDSDDPMEVDENMWMGMDVEEHRYMYYKMYAKQPCMNEQCIE